MQDRSPPATLFIGRPSARAILAGLYLLLDHAADGYENPAVLEVGEQFTDLEPPTRELIGEIVQAIEEAFPA